MRNTRAFGQQHCWSYESENESASVFFGAEKIAQNFFWMRSLGGAVLNGQKLKC